MGTLANGKPALAVRADAGPTADSPLAVDTPAGAKPPGPALSRAIIRGVAIGRADCRLRPPARPLAWIGRLANSKPGRAERADGGANAAEAVNRARPAPAGGA